MLPADLVAKLNECATTNLVGPRDDWFSWLARFTTMVAVGLVFELPELAYELRVIVRDRISRFRYRIRTPAEHRLQQAKVIAFMGWILIVAGVAGERVAEVKVKDLDVRIQECSDAKVREVTIEAGEAKDSAKTAHEEADAVKGIADEARRDAKDALAKAKAAQRSLAKAEGDAKKAQTAASGALTVAREARREAAEAASHLNFALERAANAEAEAGKLKARFADRTLTDDQARNIAAKIRPFAGQEFDITPYWELKEPMAIANRILNVLEFGGWKYVPPAQSGFMLGGVSGVQVWVHPAAPDSVKKAAEALASALNAQNMTAYIKEQNPKNPMDRKIHLNVGTKE